MRGGDLEGAYLVTRANEAYPIFVKTPEEYSIPEGMCIQSLGNLYGNPMSGQNLDKCVKEYGYTNTPWDPIPYLLDKTSLFKLDNASPAQLFECSKFPYRRVVGQLMYGMVYTLVSIMYALNVLS